MIKNTKVGLWGKIAAEMVNAGFNVGIGREASEKCRQKFANLQRAYINFINHVNKTGQEFQKEPPFYEQLHEILGDKDKVHPKYLKDSLDSTQSGIETPEAGPSTIHTDPYTDPKTITQAGPSRIPDRHPISTQTISPNDGDITPEEENISEKQKSQTLCIYQSSFHKNLAFLYGLVY